MYKTLLTLTLAAALAGCTAMQPEVSSGPTTDAGKDAAAAQLTATTAPAMSAYGPMATVNGKPIDMKPLVDLLVENDGLAIADQLVANELVDQEAAKQKVTVTADEIKAEHKRTLQRSFATTGVLSDADQEKVLQQYLGTKVARRLWDLTMRRNVQLNKLAAQYVKITDKDLQDYFHVVYGRKVVVRHIQFDKLEKANQLLELIDAGADFKKLAEAKSMNPETRGDGGLLPAIGPETKDIPPAIKQAALAMKKVGEISDVISTGTAYHLLCVDHFIEPKNVKFDDVKKTLREQLFAAKQAGTGQEMLRLMIIQAKASGGIEYVNQLLKAQDQARSSKEGKP